MRFLKPWVVALAVTGAICVGLMSWYEWGATSLDRDEVDEYIEVIEAQTQNPGARHDLPLLRRFLEHDDGKPIYTVNMYNFHETANYPESSSFSGTGKEAYERFSKVMIPLMVKRGSHPVYSSDWVDTANSRWDRIVIVRYRSRRDLVDLFATDDFADASQHKWASLQEHDRLLVQATHIPDGRYAILLFGIFSGLVAYLLTRVLSNRAK